MRNLIIVAALALAGCAPCREELAATPLEYNLLAMQVQRHDLAFEKTDRVYCADAALKDRAVQKWDVRGIVSAGEEYAPEGVALGAITGHPLAGAGVGAAVGVGQAVVNNTVFFNTHEIVVFKQCMLDLGYRFANR